MSNFCRSQSFHFFFFFFFFFLLLYNNVVLCPCKSLEEPITGEIKFNLPTTHWNSLCKIHSYNSIDGLRKEILFLQDAIHFYYQGRNIKRRGLMIKATRIDETVTLAYDRAGTRDYVRTRANQIVVARRWSRSVALISVMHTRVYTCWLGDKRDKTSLFSREVRESSVRLITGYTECLSFPYPLRWRVLDTEGVRSGCNTRVYAMDSSVSLIEWLRMNRWEASLINCIYRNVKKSGDITKSLLFQNLL